jgi:hypothetical protein
LSKSEVLDRRIQMRGANKGTHPVKRGKLFIQFGDNVMQVGLLR